MPLDLKSPNVSGGNRGRAFAGRRAFRLARDAAHAYACDAKVRLGIPAATGKRRVSLTRVCGPRQRMMDHVNWAAACKPVLDSLVRSRLLVDDSRKWVDDTYPPDILDRRAEGPAVLVKIWSEDEP